MPGVPPGISSLQIHNEGDTALLRAPALPAAPGLQARHDAASSAHTAPGWLRLQQNGWIHTMWHTGLFIIITSFAGKVGASLKYTNQWEGCVAALQNSCFVAWLQTDVKSGDVDVAWGKV